MRASAHSRVEPRADADPPQIAIRSRGPALLGGFLLIIAGVWIGVPVRGLLVGVPEVVPGLGAAGAGIALLIGAALALVAVSWMLQRRVVAIEGDLVTMTDRRLLGTRTWREPLSGYRGVRLRDESRPHRYGARHCHVIELWHPKPARTVELDRIREPRLADRQAEVWARRFGLPLCRGPEAAPPSGEVEVRDEVATEAALAHGAAGAMVQPAAAGSAVATRVDGRVPGAQPG
jgi:hypothetical protein